MIMVDVEFSWLKLVADLRNSPLASSGYGELFPLPCLLSYWNLIIWLVFVIVDIWYTILIMFS